MVIMRGNDPRTEGMCKAHLTLAKGAMWIIIVMTVKWKPDGCLLRVSFTQLKVICPS